MKKKTCAFMDKFWVQLTLLVLAVAAVACFVFLSVKIHYWEKQLAAAQKKIKKGQHRLVRGKQRLKAGKQELSEGKAEYDEAEDSMFSEVIDDVFDGGDGFATARDDIAKGEKLIAGGKRKLTAGKRRLTAGRERIDKESGYLTWAKGVRIGCGVLAAILVALLIFLRFFKK